MKRNHLGLFTDAEIERLVLLALPAGGATEDQIMMFIRKCEAMKADSLILELIMKGKVRVNGYTKNDFTLGRA